MNSWTPPSNIQGFNTGYQIDANDLFNNIAGLNSRVRTERETQGTEHVPSHASVNMTSRPSRMSPAIMRTQLPTSIGSRPYYRPQVPATSKITNLADREAFSVTDYLMLPGILKGLGLNFAINLSEFPSDDVTISDAGALLKASARTGSVPQLRRLASTSTPTTPPLSRP